jgi:hypothetical protein
LEFSIYFNYIHEAMAVIPEKEGRKDGISK